MPYAINSGENLLLKFNLIDLPVGGVWKGPWDGATAYILNDCSLGTDNLGYKCILAHTNHAPPNVTYWAVLTNILAATVVGVVVEVVDASVDPSVTKVIYTYSRGPKQTAGLLNVGSRYIITNFVTGDDFTNCGAGSNTTGVVFVATNTTPTDWTNGSTLQVMNLPANITLVDGLLQMELLKEDTKPLDGDYELRMTISFASAMYIQSGAQTDVLCLPEALTVTPC